MLQAVKFGVAALCVFLLAVTFTTFLMTTQNPGQAPAAAPRADTGEAQRQYDSWVALHEAAGGDRRVRIGLDYAEGLSVTRTQARGEAVLDLVAGEVTVEVHGLRQDVSEVWLVDDQPGAGRSSVPEPGDGMLYLGHLTHHAAEHRASLATDLDPETLARFEVDKVVVTRNGEDPIDGPVLVGSPGLFQRLYTRQRRERLAEAATARALSPQPF